MTPFRKWPGNRVGVALSRKVLPLAVLMNFIGKVLTILLKIQIWVLLD